MTVATCPKCNAEMKTPEGAEGRKIRCPSCRVTLLVTQFGVELPREDSATFRVVAPENRSTTRERSPSVRRPPVEDDEEDEEVERRPRRRRRASRGGIPAGVWVGGGVALALLVGVGAVVLLIGKLGGDGYDKVKNGMTEDEVTKLMGKPTQQTGFGDMRVMQWISSKGSTQISFMNGRVQHKQRVNLKSNGDFEVDVGDIEFPKGRPGFPFP